MQNSPQFILRWKGQQFGPFTQEVIEGKVRDHELSLAHEIQVDGKWRSLRSFLNLEARSQEQERQKIRLKRMQDDLTLKEGTLQDLQTQLEKTKDELDEVRTTPQQVTQQDMRPFMPPGMQACPKCGMGNRIDARFCSVCMERLTPLNHYEYAGFWARFCAMFLDGIIVVCLETGSGFLIGFILGFIRGATRTYQGYEEYIILGVILSWLIPWLYSAGMESSLRQGTLGKRAMGMIVTDLKGNQISFGKATGRYFGKFVSVFTLGIGYLMAAFTERKQALHDMMAGCLVVKRS